MTGTSAIAEVNGLWVETPTAHAILEDISLSMAAGTTLGIVGESGSGKTTLALALLHYAQRGARFRSGDITIAGETHAAINLSVRRASRGRTVSYVPQNPGTALSPSMRIGDAIDEMLAVHRPDLRSPDTVRAALKAVGLPVTDAMLRRFPHQLSGGQLQRVCIALAIVCEPPIVVLDEPTTGLDVVTQAGILSELQRLRDERGITMVYVSHDLAVVAQMADRIAVMYAGRIIELGATGDIITRPKHPYTQGLLESIPDHLRPRRIKPMRGISVGIGQRPQGCRFAPRCEHHIDTCSEAVPTLEASGDRFVRCLRVDEIQATSSVNTETWQSDANAGPAILKVSGLRAVHTTRAERVVAAEKIDLKVAAGTCVALVGESGSGKTTIGRAIAGLHPDVEAGTINLGDEILAPTAQKRTREQCRRIQLVFQNPSDALNPKHTVLSSIARPAVRLRGISTGAAEAEVARLLELVRLPANVMHRYPAELSGGECQRVGIARALAADPDVMICDEITSALDVSVQAAVLELLHDLIDRLGLAVLFITHDLGVVATLAHEVLVLSGGYVVESGKTSDILRDPTHEHTRRLITAAPSLSSSRADAATKSMLSQGITTADV